MSDPQRTRAPWRLEIECYKGTWGGSILDGWQYEYHWITWKDFDTQEEAVAEMADLRKGDPLLSLIHI